MLGLIPLVTQPAMRGNRILKLGRERVLRGEAIVQDEGMDAHGLGDVTRQLAVTARGVGDASAAVCIDDHSVGGGLDRLDEDTWHAAGIDFLVGDPGGFGGKDVELHPLSPAGAAP